MIAQLLLGHVWPSGDGKVQREMLTDAHDLYLFQELREHLVNHKLPVASHQSIQSAKYNILLNYILIISAIGLQINGVSSL